MLKKMNFKFKLDDDHLTFIGFICNKNIVYIWFNQNAKKQKIHYNKFS